MGISLKEIENRKYDGKELMSFEYTVKDLEGPHGETQVLRVWFERINPQMCGIETNNPTYKVFTIDDDKVYQKLYIMPKSGMPLELVGATGLNQLRSIFQTEAGHKEMLSYTIAEIIRDM